MSLPRTTPCGHKCRDKTACKHTCCKFAVAAREDPSNCPIRHGGAPQPGIYPRAEEVFWTAELLEMILEYLSPRDLTALRRVDNFWHSLLTTSAPLQKCQFLAPDDRDIAPSSLDPFPSGSKDPEDPLVRVRHFNNALFNREEPGPPPAWLKRLGPRGCFTLKFLQSPIAPGPDNMHLRAFITQPPCPWATVQLELYSFYTPGEDSDAQVENIVKSIGLAVPEGITYGHVVNECKRLVEKEHEGVVIAGVNFPHSRVDVYLSVKPAKEL